MLVSVHENAIAATPDNLQQLYMVCEHEEKLNVLWSFLTSHRFCKTLIFVACCKEVCELESYALGAVFIRSAVPSQTWGFAEGLMGRNEAKQANRSLRRV